MPNKKKITISGRLKTDDDKTLEGALLQVIEKQNDSVLGETYSGKNGVFRTEIDLSQIADVPKKKLEVSIIVRDGNDRTIGKSKNIVLKPGEDLGDLIEINSKKIGDYIPAANPPKNYSGPLHNKEAMYIVRDAVALSYKRGTPMYNRFVNAANCPLPPLFSHENIMDAATGVIEGDAYSRKELTEILELYAHEDVGFETKLDKLVADGFEQGEMDERKRLSRDKGRNELLGKIDRKIQFGDQIASKRIFHSQAPVQPQSLSVDPGKVGYTPHPDGGLDLGNPCLIPGGRFKALSMATLLAAENPNQAAHLMRGLEIGLCGLGRTHTILNAAHTALQTENPKHLIGLLSRSVRECGPDDGPPRDPFPGRNPGGCSPPFDELPERCKPPVECIFEGARKLHGVFARGEKYDIDSINPPEACPGEQIRITGSNFGNQGGRVCFSFSPSRLRLPGGGGICVKADSWSDDEILVTVPDNAPSGYVSLSIVERTDRICGNAVTVYRKGNSIEFKGGSTHLRLYLDQFRCMAPGENLTIRWNAKPADANVDISIERNGNNIKTWNNKGASGSVSWNAPNYSRPETLTVTATADGECGSYSESETIEVNVVPDLTITGMEITQGIQTYDRTDGTPDNNLATIANKDTIVRVYIDCDRNGFDNDTLDDVTGTLTVGGTTLNPINGQSPSDCSSWNGGDPFITARARSAIDRTETNHTLNFRIPAALSNGTKNLRARITGPKVCNNEPGDSFSMNWTWRSETALRVRYVRIRNDNSNTGTADRPTVAEARCTINRGFDLLPSPPTDIGPARLATHNTNRDFTTNNGLQNLLADLDDEHNCSTWEWWTQIFGNDCPDDDNAYWVGLTGPFNRGWAYRPGNTCMSAIYDPSITFNPNTCSNNTLLRIKTAHELGHNIGRRHINLNGCGNAPSPYDTLPNNGVLIDVPFDPFWNMAINGTVSDFMSYSNPRWTSGEAWKELRSEI